jgi:hypothetical protein
MRLQVERLNRAHHALDLMPMRSRELAPPRAGRFRLVPGWDPEAGGEAPFLLEAYLQEESRQEKARLSPA